MNLKRNKKLCWNCEGIVDREALHCLFCGVTIPRDDEGQSPPLYPKSTNEDAPLQPLYPPPSYSVSTEDIEPTALQEEAASLETTENVIKSGPTPAPLLFLLAGTFLFAFAIVLLLFAKDNLFTLTWNASYWYVYFLLSLPLLIYGWLRLNKSSTPD